MDEIEDLSPEQAQAWLGGHGGAGGAGDQNNTSAQDGQSKQEGKERSFAERLTDDPRFDSLGPEMREKVKRVRLTSELIGVSNSDESWDYLEKNGFTPESGKTREELTEIRLPLLIDLREKKIVGRARATSGFAMSRAGRLLSLEKFIDLYNQLYGKDD